MVQLLPAQDGKSVEIRAGNFWDLPESTRRQPWGIHHEVPVPRQVQSRSPVSISKALQESCGGYIKDFAVIYIDYNGSLSYETSPLISHRGPEIFSDDFCRSFVDLVEEQRETQESQSVSCVQSNRRRRAATKDRRRHTETLGTQYGQSTCPVARKKRPIISTDLSQTSPIRRRMPTQRIIIATQSSSCSTSDDEDDDASESDAYEGASQTMISFAVTDVEALKKFYITRFIQMQQIPCKMINKAWIKVVQPKKQARHPYNGGKENKDLGKKDAGERTKPDWWPPVGCRHKEPDHIQKPERLVLSVHLLRNLYGYDGRDGNAVTVEMLEQSTRECFANNQKYEPARKYLDDVYHVRRQEERYLRGEIDATAVITVNMPDKEPKVTTAKKQPRLKIRAKAKRPRARAPLASQPASHKRPSVVSRHQSPTILDTSIEQMVICRTKPEPLKDFSRSGLFMEREQLSPQHEQCFQRQDSLNTAQSSFSATDISWSPVAQFKTPAVSLMSFSTVPAFHADAERQLGFVPLPAVGVQYAEPDFQRMKAFNTNQREPLTQMPIQDVNWMTPSFSQPSPQITSPFSQSSPPFPQSTPNSHTWSFPSIPTASMQQQQQQHSTSSVTNGLPTTTPFMSPDIVQSNRGQGITETLFTDGQKCFPQAMDYSLFGNLTPPGTQHGLPGFGYVPRENGGFH